MNKDKISVTGESRYRFRYAYGYGTLFYIFLLLLIHLYMTISIWMRQDRVIVPQILFTVFIAVTFVIYMILTIRRERSYPKELVIGADSITVGRRQFLPSQIKRIRVQGYFNPMIEIKPEGSFFVPHDMMIRMLEQEEEAIKELKTWAHAHQIAWK